MTDIKTGAGPTSNDFIECRCGGIWTHEAECGWGHEVSRRQARYDELLAGSPVSSFDDVDIIFRNIKPEWPPMHPPKKIARRANTEKT